MIAIRAGEALGVGVVEGQGIEGEVVRREIQGGVERRHPAGHALVGHVVEEVEADRSDPRLTRLGDRIGDVPRLVAATDATQLRVVERLRPDRQPRDAGANPAGRIAALVRSGIGLERDLGIDREAVSRPDPIDEVGDDVGLEEGRRPATEVQRLEGRSGPPEGRIQGIGSQIQLGLERGDEGVHAGARAARRGARIDDEIAVRAERDAERDVDVERDRRTSRDRGRPCPAPFIAPATR